MGQVTPKVFFLLCLIIFIFESVYVSNFSWKIIYYILTAMVLSQVSASTYFNVSAYY